jgi:hypothetical protein
VLHRCGASFYFLIASTWRNENELWETVWYRREQQAWVRFLQSERDAEAADRWLHDVYRGPA